MTELPQPQGQQLKHIIEAALLAADEPLTLNRIAELFPDDQRPAKAELGEALELLASDCQDRGVELIEVASGYRLQVRSVLQPWVARLWTEKPQKYSRAMLETLSLIAYRQPITRGEIESVRGVSLSSNIIRSLQEREWVRIVGHRDVPGKPALFGTTRTFLDYFQLKSLDELPTLAEIKDMDTLEPELALDGEDNEGAAGDDRAADGEQRDALNDEAHDEYGQAPGDELGDDELDDAFAALDQAFGRADDIDLGDRKSEAEPDADPDDEQPADVQPADDQPDDEQTDDEDPSRAAGPVKPETP